MKRIFTVIGDILLYYVVALLVGLLVDKTIGIDRSIWIYAITLTIGWGIWKIAKFFMKRFNDKKEKDKNC